tara:strand:+ start:1120 stop:2553 length:1434 start_codon:yes stop_codon:yes gene_type:complete
MALKDLLIICGGDSIIINWLNGLERCFAGVQKSLTSIRNLKGERKYYEYRRTALPYIIWIAENLNYVDLSELGEDYADYILECLAGSSPESNYARLRKSLFNQSVSTILSTDLPTQLQAAATIQSHPAMEKVYYPPHYVDNTKRYRQYKGLPMQTQLSTMDPSDRTDYANALRAYYLLTRKIGSVGLLYLLSKELGSSFYSSSKLKKLWKSLPRSTRFWATMKVNRLYGLKDMWQQNYYGSYGTNKMIDRLLEESGWEVTSDLSFRTGDVRRILESYYEGLWNYHNVVRTTLEEYDKSRKIYETLTPETIDHVRTGLEQLRDAFTVLGTIAKINPVIDFSSHDRAGKIPTDLDYIDFEKTMKKLGFQPELSTFEIQHCEKCNGKGGTTSNKPMICRTCQGWGVLGLPDSVKTMIPKMMYSSKDVSSYAKTSQLQQRYNNIYGRLNFGRTEQTDYEIKKIDQHLTTLNVLEKGIKPKV